MAEPSYVRLAGRAVLPLAGEDVRDLLQGLISNDVRLLGAAHSLYAALLTPQGKYLFDFLLHDAGDGGLLLDAERDRALELRQRLTMYRLRARATIGEPDAALAVLAVFGEGTPARLGLPASAGATRRDGPALLAVDPRLEALGARVILPGAEIAAFAARHDLAAGDEAAYDSHRLALGVPDGSRDLLVQKAILLESNFEELHGVSFDKGCFIGQELTARTKHRALVRKRLLPVRVEGALPEPGTVIAAGAQEAGEMRSGRGGRGLALLRLEPALAAIRGEVELRAGDIRLEPEIPDWIRLGSA